MLGLELLDLEGAIFDGVDRSLSLAEPSRIRCEWEWLLVWTPRRPAPPRRRGLKWIRKGGRLGASGREEVVELNEVLVFGIPAGSLVPPEIGFWVGIGFDVEVGFRMGIEVGFSVLSAGSELR